MVDAEFPDGYDFGAIVTNKVSVAALFNELTLKNAPVVVSAVADPWVLVPFDTTVMVTPLGAACDGTAEITPSPSEAAATSARRLIVVLVDIYFLSIVVIEDFPMAALR